jgi:hypothetical protein
LDDVTDQAHHPVLVAEIEMGVGLIKACMRLVMAWGLFKNNLELRNCQIFGIQIITFLRKLLQFVTTRFGAKE